MGEAAILRSTMTDRITVTRASRADPLGVPETVYHNLPCALSRTAMVTAPHPHDPGQDLAECGFRATVFLPAGTGVQVGDHAAVLRQGTRLTGVLSPGFPYPSYTVAVMNIQEVTQL